MPADLIPPHRFMPRRENGKGAEKECMLCWPARITEDDPVHEQSAQAPDSSSDRE